MRTLSPLVLFATLACGTTEPPVRVTVDAARVSSAEREGSGGRETTPMETPLEADVDQCGGLFDGADFVKVTGNRSDLALDADDVLVVKVAGNQNGVVVTLDGEAGPGDSGVTTTTGAIGGACFILTGNQSTASLAVAALTLDKLVVIARGNQPSVTVDAASDATISEIDLELRGNGARFELTGEGTVACPTADARGNGPTVICP